MFALLNGRAHAADVRGDFLKLIDRPRVDLSPQIATTQTANGIDEIPFSYMAETGQRVPALLIKRTGDTTRRGVVIALHGTGGKKEDMAAFLHQVAAAGMIGVAIDGRYHGQRTPTGHGSSEYQDAIVRAWREKKEHPFFYDTAWDVMRLIDYLQTRDDIDAKRIGLYGVSKGGIETYLTAAVDERVTAAVPCIGVQSFRWALDHDAWRPRIETIPTAFENIAKDARVTPDAKFVGEFYERVAPGLAGEFDGPSMVPLIAPRALMMINGDSDARTPMGGLRECIDAAKEAYRRAGAEDKFVPVIEEKTAHKVTPEAQRGALEFFRKSFGAD